ncbi:hypothetical protein [Effusibacillus consociatus]|uniref:DUF1801 domain-containing protein n=1 Tax=Effusibacillus consociatus TaxID=1117041 RepID=A0ABV9Q109_9BACL
MTNDFSQVYQELKSILKESEPYTIVKIDNDREYSMNSSSNPRTKGEGFFGAVQIRKEYVSYHLMPVYVYPELLENTSESLKKRMQGKSCFNFKKVDSELFQELQELTQKGFEKYTQHGWFP